MAKRKYFSIKEQRAVHDYMVKAYPGVCVSTHPEYWQYSPGRFVGRLYVYAADHIHKEFRSFDEFVAWTELDTIQRKEKPLCTK